MNPKRPTKPSDAIADYNDTIVPNDSKRSVPSTPSRAVDCNEARSRSTTDAEPLRGSTTDEEPTINERTTALVRGLLLVCKHHRVNPKVQHCLDQQVHEYLDGETSEGIWQKKVKDLTTYPMARYLRNELPEFSYVRFSPKGALSRFFRNWLNAFSRRNTHFWYSWLQCKRSCLPVSDDLVEDAYKDHQAALTRPDVGDRDVIRRIFEDKAFSRILDDMSYHVFEQFLLTPEVFDPHRHAPSTNACWEKTRQEGGQAEHLREVAQGSGFGTELLSMTYVPRSYGAKRTNAVLETRTGDLGLFRCFFPEKKPNLSCAIQAVIEPLKVRIISKGEAVPYFWAKPFQKILHSYMRNLPCFELIGRRLDPTDLLPLAQTSHRGWEWFSVDYSAATDNLSWLYSGQIFERLISGLPDSYQDLYRSVLGFHDLHYPIGRGLREFRGRMTCGQLMGSVLSFPLLCLANLGVYLLNTQEIQDHWSTERRLRSVLINGDDMLYCAPRDLWDRHAQYSKAVGLKMSVGKSYVHPVYANINSTSFHLKLDVPRFGELADQVFSPDMEAALSSFTSMQIDFLNVGLFFQNHKVMSKKEDEMSRSDSVATVIPLVLKGSLPGRQGDLLSMYLHQNSKQISHSVFSYVEVQRGRKYPFIRNLFVRKEIGGMGIEPPLYWRYRFTRMQRNVAKTLLCQDEDIFFLSVGPPPEGFFEPRRFLDYKVGNYTVFSQCMDETPVLRLQTDKYGRAKEFTIKARKLSYEGAYLI